MGKRNGAEFYADPSAPPIKTVDCGVYAPVGRRDGTTLYDMPIDGGYGKKRRKIGSTRLREPSKPGMGIKVRKDSPQGSL